MSTQPLEIQLGEWLPDLPAFGNPGVIRAENCIAQRKSYRSLNSLTSFTNALANAALGHFWAQDDDNVVFNFAGDTDALYQLVSGTTWTDISGGSAPYNATSWDFTKFGDRIIATSLEADAQYFDMATSSAFADLPGTPPRARRCATVRDFVVFGDTELNGGGDDDTVGPNWIQWSGYNNSETWVPSLATQSDRQELFGRGGRVQRIVPGEYGLVFQEHSIYAMTYAPPPLVFQLDEVERHRGTPAPRSVVWAGTHVFYYGWDGFYYFDGQQSRSISDNKCSRWVRQNANASVLNTMYGVLDRRNRLIIWAFRSSVSSTINDRLVIYNWAANRWTYALVDTEILAESVATGYTLDELDSILPDGIDLDSIGVDSDAFKGGAINLIAFDSSNRAANFSGAPATAVFETGEYASKTKHRMYVNGVTPEVNSSDPSLGQTVQVGTRNTPDDSVVWSAPKAPYAATGEASVRNSGRYMRFRLNITGEFEHAYGVSVQVNMTGGKR